MESFEVETQLFHQSIAMLSFQVLRSHALHQWLVTLGHDCLANTHLSGYTHYMVSSKDQNNSNIICFLARATKGVAWLY